MTCLDARDVFARFGVLPRGYVTLGNQRAPMRGVVYAHRHVYEQAFGPIPTKHDIHHTCHNRACVNPEHLVALTKYEHRQEHRATHCKHGHELTPENVMFDPWPRCRTCRDARQLERRSTPEYRAGARERKRLRYADPAYRERENARRRGKAASRRAEG